MPKTAIVLTGLVFAAIGSSGPEAGEPNKPHFSMCLGTSAISYFKFNSDRYLSDDEIKVLKISKPDALIGLNPLQEPGTKANTVPDYFRLVVPAMTKRMQELRQNSQNFKVNLYLEGPHGATGADWDPDERARMERLAIFYYRLHTGALQTSDQSASPQALDYWFSGGWMDYLKQQLKAFQGVAYSFEVDNIIGDTRYNAENPEAKKLEKEKKMPRKGSPRALVSIYKELFDWMDAQKPRIDMKLTMKNLTPDELDVIYKAVTTGKPKLSRGHFSEYHIAEKERDDLHHNDPVNATYRAIQAQKSARLGIQLVPSNNTYTYHSEGSYDPKCLGGVAKSLAGADVERDDNILGEKTGQ